MVRVTKRVKIKSTSHKRAKLQAKSNRPAKKWHPTPLKGSFMVMSIIGVLASYYVVLPQSLNFGASFLIIFLVMFIASLISMTKAPIINERL